MDKSYWLKYVWKKETRMGCFSDTFRAMELVAEAYHFDFINWNSYQLAIDMIGRVKNGSWMFENRIQLEKTRRNK
jgi:hypothetical protein